MAKLVVYYSRAGENYFGGSYRHITVGNTEKLAQILAGQVGADLWQIRQKQPYAEAYQTCIRQAQQDQRNQARPALEALPENLDRWQEIYLGYPNYWGDMPMAVYTFLEAFDWSGKIIHPFCTHEGSGLSGTERKIAAVCKGAQVTPGLAVLGSRVEESQSAVAHWLRG